jgi:uncharacterized protein (TIGR03000 family)
VSSAAGNPIILPDRICNALSPQGETNMARIGLIMAILAASVVLAGEKPTSPQQGVARLIVILPAEAVLTVNGQATKQTGPQREFVTPPLLSGRDYSAVLHARWRENGQDVVVEREVTLRAGETVRVVLDKASANRSEPRRQREFLFTYEATLTGLPPGKLARLWFPVPSSNAQQDVTIVEQKLPPQAKAQMNTEAKYGNRILYVEAPADGEGKIPVSVTYRVLRREARGDEEDREANEGLIRLFLGADSRVPVGGKALRLLEGKPLPTDQLKLARMLYDTVNEHMVYSKKGTGWGQGDAEWACDNGYGNCTDFHSLFIALARAQGIPARFEIGFPLPEERGEGEVPGYHCWAWFKPKGRGWIPVDISEANKVKNTRPEMVEYYFGNLTPDRVAFSVGRDIQLVPPQSGPPLNFFIYPYAEVDGRPLDATQIQRKFRYKDLR